MKQSYEHKYKLKYKVEHECGEFTKQEILNENAGGADALIIFSLIYPEDGSFSQNFSTVDGRTGMSLPDNEVYKVWVLLSHRLANSKTLAEGTKELARTIFKIITADSSCKNSDCTVVGSEKMEETNG